MTQLDPDLDLSYLLTPVEPPSGGLARVHRVARRRTIVRRTAGTMAALVGVLGVFGVLTKSGSRKTSVVTTIASPLDAIRAAPAAMRKGGTVYYHGDVVIEPPGQPAVRAVDDGAFDYRSGRGHHATPVVGGRPGSEVLAFPDRVYIRSPEGGAAAGASSRWRLIDAKNSGSDAETVAAGIYLFSRDALFPVEWLATTAEPVTDLGPEEVRGVATHHYRAATDIHQLPDSADPALRAVVKALKITTPLPVDVWLSADGLVRRLAYTASQEIDMGGAKSTSTSHTSVEFFDFGRRVDVKAPPASEVDDPSAEQATTTAAPSPPRSQVVCASTTTTSMTSTTVSSSGAQPAPVRKSCTVTAGQRP